MTTAAHIEALLKAHIGLDAAAIGSGVLERAVRERLAAVQAGDHQAYWNLLHSAPDEFQALIEAVIVPETWFFRHREALLALGRFAGERIFGDGARQLRVLSLPCSSGEEPYSIAMALLDAGIPAGRFQVDAVDISARSLERARAGQYGSNSFRGTPLDFRDRHFTPCAGGYSVDAHVRAQVRLLRGNLVDPNLLAGEAPYDFVFCRNLLIYFDADAQARAVRTLVRLTAHDGMIFVGPAEASMLSAQGLAAAGVPLAFAFHKAAGVGTAQRCDTPAVLPPVPAWQPPPVRQAPAPAAHKPRRVPHKAAPPAAPQPARRDEMPDALAAVAGLADRGDLAAATSACLALLARQGPGADAYCMLGVLYDAAGRTADAHESYRKALYLDPAHQEALYHLAALLDTEGDHTGATRLRHRAQRHTRTDHG
jgi:chemotaxis protein methyltransferase WspC